MLLIAVFVDVAGTIREAAFIERDLAHAAVGSQLDALAHGRGPVGDVGAALRALRAADEAGPEVDASCAAPVFLGRNRAVRRPPVPAEFVEALRERFTELAERDRRQRRLLGRIGGIAREARHAHHLCVHVVEGFEGRVVDRPIVGDAIEALHPEIRRMEAREVCGVQDRAAADRVEVRDLDGRLVVVDRVVVAPPATIRAETVRAEAFHLPVVARRRIFGRVHPAALFEADDAHPRFREAPRDRGARGSRTDDQNVDRFFRHWLACESSNSFVDEIQLELSTLSGGPARRSPGSAFSDHTSGRVSSDIRFDFALTAFVCRQRCCAATCTAAAGWLHSADAPLARFPRLQPDPAHSGVPAGRCHKRCRFPASNRSRRRSSAT